MIEPIVKPRRKNPLQRTRLPTSPPRARSRASHGFTRAAAEGRFMLQRCGACGAFCYPARDACPACLSADLVFTDAPRRGTLLSETTLRIPPTCISASARHGASDWLRWNADRLS